MMAAWVVHAVATLQGGMKSPTTAGTGEKPVTGCLQALTVVLPVAIHSSPS